jgi:peptidoglycan/LPS O-acetylase OafA/YrhL
MKRKIVFYFFIEFILRFSLSLNPFPNIRDEITNMLSTNNSIQINKQRVKLPDNEECEIKTDNLLSYIFNRTMIMKNYSEAMKFIIYSGDSLNDFGDYYGCKKLNFSNFHMISLKADLQNPTKAITLRLGICYFRECDISYLNNIKIWIDKAATKKFNQTLQEDYLIIKDVDQELQNYRNGKFVGFIITLTFIAFFIFLYILNGVLIKTRLGKTNTPRIEPKKEEEKVSIIINQENYINEEVENKNKKTHPKAQKEGVIKYLLRSFDFVENLKRFWMIRKTNKTMTHLKIFDGVRVLSTMWVLYGHTFYQPMVTTGYSNIQELPNLLKQPRYSILISALFSVDVFFYLGGFLFYISIQKLMNKSIPKIKIMGLAILNRYIRILPLYAFVVYGMTFLLPFLGYGPMYHELESFNSNCIPYGWHNMLYIQNLVHYSANTLPCAAHTWYLACDMQFFILSIILFISLNNYQKIRNTFLLLIFISSCFFSTYYAYIHHYLYNDYVHEADMPQETAFTDYNYKPWIRIGPYLLGIFFGELFLQTPLYQNDNQIKEEKGVFSYINNFIAKRNMMAYSIFFISIFFINLTIFTSYFTNNYFLPYGLHAFFITFNKLIFTFSFGCIMHLTFLGKLNWIRKLLSLDIFTRVGRLAYGVYQVHMYFILMFVGSYTSMLYVKISDFIFLALGLFIFSAFTSLFLSILIESPIINFFKKFISPPGGKNE